MNAIPPDNIRKHFDDVGRIFRIVMMVMPMWRGANNQGKLTHFDKDYIFDIFKNTNRGLDPNPNWASLWIIPKNMQGPEDLSDDTTSRFEIYPAVMFQCHVHIKG